MANFTDDDLKRLLQQTNNPDIARTAQEQLDISKQNKDSAKEVAKESVKTTKEVSELKKEQKKTNDALKELISLTKEQVKLQKQTTTSKTETKEMKQNADYGVSYGPTRPFFEEVKGLVKELKVASKQDVKKRDGFGTEEPEVVRELKELTKSITKSIGGAVKDIGDDLFVKAFPGLKGLVQKREENKPKAENKSGGGMSESTESFSKAIVEQQMMTNQLLRDMLKSNQDKKPDAKPAVTEPIVPERERYEFREKAGMWADTHKGVGGGQFISRKEAEKLGLGQNGEKIRSSEKQDGEAVSKSGVSQSLSMEKIEEAISRNGDKIDTANGYLKDIADHLTSTKPQQQPQAKKEEGPGLLSKLAGGAMDIAGSAGSGLMSAGKGVLSGASKAAGAVVEGAGSIATKAAGAVAEGAGAVATKVAGAASNAATQGVSKWSKFLTFLEKTAPSVFRRFMVRAGSALAGLALPGPGWVWTAINVLGSLALAYEVYNWWKEFSSQKDEEDKELPEDQQQAGRNNLEDKGDIKPEPEAAGPVKSEAPIVATKQNTPQIVSSNDNMPDISSAIMAERQAAVERKQEDDADAEKQKRQKELTFEADTIILKADKIIFTSTPTTQAPAAGAAKSADVSKAQEMGPPSPVGAGKPSGGGGGSGAAVVMQRADAVKESVAKSATAATGAGPSGSPSVSMPSGAGGGQGSGGAAGGPAAIGGASKGVGGPVSKPNLVNVKTASGKSVQVAGAYAKNFQGFISDLEATGYKISSIGGYADRANVNNPSVKSYHASGAAIDINPGSNPNKSTKTDLPAETGALAAKWGLGWGMNWKSVKDPMHFSAAKGEQGTFDIPRNGSIAAGEVEGTAASGGGGGDQGGKKEDKSKDPVGSGGPDTATPPQAKKEDSGSGAKPAKGGGSGMRSEAASGGGGGTPTPAAPSTGADLAKASSNDIASQRSADKNIAAEAPSNSGGQAPASGKEGNARFDKDNVGMVEPADAAKRLKDLFGMAA